MSLEIRFNLQRGDFVLGIDLALADTGITALFGPSGSGKTTLLRAIAGLERIDGARIRFQGNDWQDNGRFLPPHLRPVGYVFQEPSLFPHLDVRANVEYGLRRTPQSQRRLTLDDVVRLLAIGDLLDRQPATLSGGEQQRVAIARALAVNPRLLLMDEPLASLDNKLKQEILPCLETLHRELAMPVIYVSHATDEVARLADNLVVLRKGTILGSGPIQDMLTRLDLPLAHRKDAESLIAATVSGHDPGFGLTYVTRGDALFTVTGTGPAVGTAVRLRIAAQDVSLTLEKQAGTSIQNIFPVRVVEIHEESHAQVVVKVMLGQDAVLARVTRKSAQQLAIVPGKAMFAQIKTVAVLA